MGGLCCGMSRDVASRTSAAAQLAIRRLCVRGLPVLELLHEVSDQVRTVVPYAAAGWQITDPATQLGTGGFAENVDRDTHPELIENELTGGTSSSRSRG